MAIIFIIVVVSVLGLCGLYAVKLLEERGAAKFFPTLRREADHAAMRLAARVREFDLDRFIQIFVRQGGVVFGAFCRQVYRFVWTFFAGLRSQSRTFVHFVSGVGTKTPLTKGSVSLFLQRISPERKLPIRTTTEAPTNPEQVV